MHPTGELEIEFNPQGTLAERIRAAGAGIGAATGASKPASGPPKFSLQAINIV